MTAAPDLDALLDAMTLDEQAGLLSGADFWTTVPVPRLGVPAIKLTDGPNGARGALFHDGPRTACFPVGIALAATWNRSLLQATGAALGAEARLKGARVLLAPTVNLQRTVFNGRNFECHSEDPWLSSEMAVATVRGVQSQGVAATIKHYVGNESEVQRTTASSDIPERALRELYLLPFERAVKEAGVQALMTSYNRVHGTYVADDMRLLQQVLRGEWGFDGLVMTDWMARHDTVQSVLAGCDLEMPGPARERGTRLVAAVEQGRLPADAVRACARRVLALVQRVRGFADPVMAPERDDDVPAHRALIRQLGAEGLVLLKHEPVQGRPLLPLDLPAGSTVALIGRAAAQAQIMGGGSANVNAQHRVSPLEALRQARPDLRLVHLPGADLHRWTPLAGMPMALQIRAGGDGSGPVVGVQHTSDTEARWIGSLPPGIAPGQVFHARTTLRWQAQEAGEHVFSLISAGCSRAWLNGALVLDAWDGWRSGEPYFGYGCSEVLHRRLLRAGEVVDVVLEYRSTPPSGTDGPQVGVSALRFGASRLLGDADIAAAEAVARDADVAIVFAGLNDEWDNEGMDRPGMSLPHQQDALVARVAAANPRTVVVLQSGSPLLLPWLDEVPAVLQAWYPGQEAGHAIADVLLGLADPGGRLPQTWPQRLEDTVAHGDAAAYPGLNGRVAYTEGLLIGYRHHEARGIAPRFPFGHGLSYTTFAFSDLQLDTTTLQPGQALTVSLTVRNTGARAGSTVVQLYVHDAASTLARPPQELKGFEKLQLARGESRRVQLVLDMRAFAAYDDRRNLWWAEAGDFELRAGASSADTPLRATVRLAADWASAP